MNPAGARVVVGLSGASGAAIGVRVVEILVELEAEVHLVVSRAGARTLAHEVGADALGRIERLAARRHPILDVGACIASGSFSTRGMVVAPCSVRTLSAIAFSLADNLLVRAADVHLKERRPLALLVRESPLHLGHLRSMTQVTEMGGIIAVPAPAFYMAPPDMAAAIDQIARRTVGHLGAEFQTAAEWIGQGA